MSKYRIFKLALKDMAREEQKPKLLPMPVIRRDWSMS